MKKVILLICLFGVMFLFSNCSDADDLTIEIVGEYVGAYGSNTNGNINPYEVVVSKVDNDMVSIRPKNGSEFESFDIQIELSNSSTIVSPADSEQQLVKSVVFALSIPVGFSMSLDPTGEAHAFTGVKQ